MLKIDYYLQLPDYLFFLILDIQFFLRNYLYFYKISQKP